MANQGQLWKMYDALRKGEISRRAFLEGAVALGMALPLAQSILISTASAQDATPSGRRNSYRGIRRRSVRRNGRAAARNGRRAQIAAMAGADDAESA